jgi:hypothetical protein
MKVVLQQIMVNLFILLTAFSLFANEYSSEELTAEQLYEKALAYQNGQGVSQNDDLAIMYYEFAVAKNHALAMYNLGFIYNNSESAKYDRLTALDLWQTASSLGNSYSSYNMGDAFLTGNGRLQDYNTALEFYMRAYEQGFKEAICQYAQVISAVNPIQSSTIRALAEPLALQGNTQCLHALVQLLYEDFENYNDSETLLFWADLAVQKQIADVIFLLGLIYDFGQIGITSDYDKAKKYYLMAAELSHDSAFSNLGFMYESGKFGNPDFVTAKYYYEKSIEVGSEYGMNNLGSYYLRGLGKVVDNEKALQLFKSSAALGNALAHRNIGNMYRFGRGVQPDVYEAEKYLIKAIELENLTAILDLAELYSDKSSPLFSRTLSIDYFHQAIEKDVPNALEILAKQFSSVEREWFVKTQQSGQLAYDLAEYYQASNNTIEACNWFYVAFKRRQEDAYLNVMECVKDNLYSEVRYTDQLDVAREWARFIDWDAESLIGELYYYGIGVSKDSNIAAQYFTQAHNNTGDSIARYKLGHMYLAGDGVVKNYDEAKYMFELAAKQDLSVAYLALGNIYRAGLGVEIDEAKAFALVKKAASYNDHHESVFEYANMLFDGFHNKQNIRLAIDWYDRAIHLYHEKASCKLGKVLAKHYSGDEEKRRSVQLLKHCETAD